MNDLSLVNEPTDPADDVQGHMFRLADAEADETDNTEGHIASR